MDKGTVDRDGFALEWVREGTGTPMMVLGASPSTRDTSRNHCATTSRSSSAISGRWCRRRTASTSREITRDTFSDDVECGATGGRVRPTRCGRQVAARLDRVGVRPPLSAARSGRGGSGSRAPAGSDEGLNPRRTSSSGTLALSVWRRTPGTRPTRRCHCDSRNDAGLHRQLRLQRRRGLVRLHLRLLAAVGGR